MSEVLKISGTIAKIKKVQQVNDTFKKREFIIETDEKYPQFAKFELVQDNCSKIDEYYEGAMVSVYFNISGRKWTNKEGEDKYFVSLKAWKIEGDTQKPMTAPTIQETTKTESIGDDLPF